MTSREFCYWLQGYLEINAAYSDGASQPSMTASQVSCIQKHLNMVFKHEIDPSYPDSAELNKIHNPKVKWDVDPSKEIMRC